MAADQDRRRLNLQFNVLPRIERMRSASRNYVAVHINARDNTRTDDK